MTRLLRTAIVAVLPVAAMAQTPVQREHRACIEEFVRVVSKSQLHAMAKAAGGWDNLSGETKINLGFKAMDDAVRLALELDVRSSLATCQRTLAPIKLFVQGARP